MVFSDGFRLLFLSHLETDNVPLFRVLKERFLKRCRSYALARDEEIILFLRFEDAQIIPSCFICLYAGTEKGFTPSAHRISPSPPPCVLGILPDWPCPPSCLQSACR